MTKIENAVRQPILRILILVTVIGVLFPRDAFAYLDPGSASLIVQSLIAGLAALGVAMRLYWGKIRALFMGKHKSPLNKPTPDATNRPE